MPIPFAHLLRHQVWAMMSRTQNI